MRKGEEQTDEESDKVKRMKTDKKTRERENKERGRESIRHGS